MGWQEEHRGKVTSGKLKEFLETSKSVWKAQNGMNAEPHGEFICGGWLTWDGYCPEKANVRDRSLINALDYPLFLTKE